MLKSPKSMLISVWLETFFFILVTRLQKVFWMPFPLKQISAVVAFGLLKMLWYTKLLNLNKYFLHVMCWAYPVYALQRMDCRIKCNHWFQSHTRMYWVSGTVWLCVTSNTRHNAFAGWVLEASETCRTAFCRMRLSAEGQEAEGNRVWICEQVLPQRR